MNGTVAQLTWRALLGRRRSLLLAALPAILLLLSVVVRLAHGRDPQAAVNLLSLFALGFLVPLVGLIAGTGAIGPEIDDGSIVYLLAKPLSRPSIINSKLAVAVGVVTLFGAVPTLVAGFVTTGGADRIAVGYALAALVAGVAYCSVFVLLAVVTRNAVVVGLLYALLWESVVGGYVPGAQALSIQQWSLALAEKVIGDPAGGLGVDAAVGLTLSVILVVAVTAGATWYAGRRLRSLRFTHEQ
jgi:ABC-2 type transport system permease protein